MRFFITGTDTGVGKTHVSALLVRTLRAEGIDAVGMKPIVCGERDDAEILHAASDGVAPLGEINPIWLRPPAAPYVAAMIEERVIDLSLIREAFARLSAAHPSIIVEGAGGWFVPIMRDYFISDLAAELALPVVVVVSNKLGALNHTLLTVRAIRAAGLTCAGVILNQATPPCDPPDVAQTTNRAVLEDVLEVPILCEVEYGQQQLALPAVLRSAV